MKPKKSLPLELGHRRDHGEKQLPHSHLKIPAGTGNGMDLYLCPVARIVLGFGDAKNDEILGCHFITIPMKIEG